MDMFELKIDTYQLAKITIPTSKVDFPYWESNGDGQIIPSQNPDSIKIQDVFTQWANCIFAMCIEKVEENCKNVELTINVEDSPYIPEDIIPIVARLMIHVSDGLPIVYNGSKFELPEGVLE